MVRAFQNSTKLIFQEILIVICMRHEHIKNWSPGADLGGEGHVLCYSLVNMRLFKVFLWSTTDRLPLRQSRASQVKSALIPGPAEQARRQHAPSPRTVPSCNLDNKRAIFIMDKAPCYRDVQASSPRHPIRFLPPCSPFLNPIENCCSVLKSDAKQRLLHIQDQKITELWIGSISSI